MKKTLTPCITSDGHYVEIDNSREIEYSPGYYYVGYIYLECLTEPISSLWDLDYKHENEQLTIVRFSNGKEDVEFHALRREALSRCQSKS